MELSDLAARIRGTQPVATPPAAIPRVEAVEEKLGFRLPAPLRFIYVGVANGGFGPGGDVLGIAGGHAGEHGLTADELYLGYVTVEPDGPLPDPTDPTWRWPEKLMPFYDWGNGIYSCLDCSAEPAPVIVFDPNVQPWRDAFFFHRAALEEWLSAWLDGVDLWREMYPLGFTCALPSLPGFGQTSNA